MRWPYAVPHRTIVSAETRRQIKESIKGQYYALVYMVIRLGELAEARLGIRLVSGGSLPLPSCSFSAKLSGENAEKKHG